MDRATKSKETALLHPLDREIASAAEVFLDTARFKGTFQSRGARGGKDILNGLFKNIAEREQSVSIKTARNDRAVHLYRHLIA